MGVDRPAAHARLVHRREVGIFIHGGVYSVPAYAPVLPGKLAYAEWYWHAMTSGQRPDANPVQAGTWAYHQRQYGADYPYLNFAPQFRAELFDPDHWAEVFRNSGARYVVLTSKHHEGFALWPSREASATWGRPWNAVEVGPRRDLAGDLTAAVRRAGLKMGFYYSLYEWFNPLWLSDKPRYVDLVVMLCDLVSRGGNLLLDIGPAADGTIPVVMEERLLEIGSWLKVNGEAIYGTKPWTRAKQWSAGEVPKVDYDKEFETAYDVSKADREAGAGEGCDRGLLHRQG